MKDIDEIIRAKWLMDDATTLTEAADKLCAFADYLREIEAQGVQLTQPVTDDYGFLDGPGVVHPFEEADYAE